MPSPASAARFNRHCAARGLRPDVDCTVISVCLDKQAHRQGHLFTTIWIPGASLKAIRLGWWRFKWRPVGKHWSLVAPVKESDLSEEEKRRAGENKDVRIP